MLKRKDAGFINATLSDRRSGDRRASEVAAHRAGYFPDEGRVRRLPASPGGAAGHARYRVSFDDMAGDGLCLSLDGGSMWAGKLWSDRLPLTLIAS